MKKFTAPIVLALSLALTGGCDSGEKKTDAKSKTAKKKDSKKDGKDKKKKDAVKADAKGDTKPDAKGDAKAPDAKADGDKPEEKAAMPEPPPHILAVTHDVKDYAAWKKAFDEHEKDRVAAGIVWHGIAHADGKENKLLVGVIGTDPAKLKGFLDSEEVKKSMKEAGVKGTPKATPWTRTARTQHAEGKLKEEDIKAMAYSTAKVKDYDAWKTAFDKGAEQRKGAGIVSELVSQGPEDKNSILVIMYAKEMDTLKKYFDNPELKEKFKESGVEGKPDTAYYVPVEQKMYAPSKEG